MPHESSECDAPIRDRDFVNSLERGLAVIRAFSADTPAMRLSGVARQTGLTRAAARRLLHTLQALGYVGHDGSLFRLKPKVLDLGYSYLSSVPMWAAAEPHVEALVGELQESSSITVLDGDELVYVVRVPTKRIMTVSLTTGSRLPAYPTSMGRVLLAELPPENLDAYLARVHLAPFTPRTVTDADRLRVILGQVRSDGWALVDQELEAGVRSVAVPLRGAGGRAVAALNASAHASRVNLTMLRDRFLPRVLAAAEAISADLQRRQGR
jgi:IclR family pca regulon transcriptional regulator